VRLLEAFDGAPEGSRSANRASFHTSDIDLIDLRLALIDRGPELIAYVLAAPHNRRLSTRQELRWGTKGSFSYDKKQGLWYDHELDEGGDLLELVRRRIVSGFPEAVRWAREWLGWPTDRPPPINSRRDELRRQQAEKQAKAEAQQLEEDRKKIARAASMWARSVSMAGTIAEQYVRETRQIPVETWPDSVRFDPIQRALIVAATNEEGELRGVQCIYLTPDADNVRREDGRKIKLSFGPQNSAAVRLPGSKQGPLLLAEGPETGLSVWASTGYETWIALGQISKLTPQGDRLTILCRDDDPPRKTRGGHVRSSNKALDGWRREGVKIAEAYPWPIRRGDKTDFNDLIKELGPESVRGRINRLVEDRIAEAGGFISLRQAEKALAEKVGEFFATAIGWSGENRPPVHAIGVTLGTGKTEAAIRYVAATIKEIRQNGDKRAIAFAVPEHKLSDEIAERLKPFGVRVAIWRGREAYKPKSSEHMCGNLEEVREAERVFADVEKEVCKTCRQKDADAAKNYEGCAYLAQKELDADVWIVGHQILIHDKPPKPINARGIAALVVDESPWRAGLFGHEGKGVEVPLDWLDPKALPIPVSVLGLRLEAIRQDLKRAIEGAEDGPLHRARLEAVGFDDETGRAAYGLEWERKIEGGPWRERQDNKTLGSMTALWRAVEAVMRPLGQAISARITLGRNKDEVRVLKIKGRKDIGEAWRVPTLVIDASLDEQLVRPYWPQLEVTARLNVETPHMTVRQATGRAYSKAMLQPLLKVEDEKGEKGQEARKRAREKLRSYVLKIDREKGGRTLVISNKSIIEALELPDFIETAHFNAVAGRDEWKDVRSIIVIGRTLPGPEGVERMAEALTDEVIEPVSDWYPRGDIDRLQRVEGGVRLVAGQADMHPDPVAESIRSRIVEGEVMQAIGRGRGVRRTVDNPLDVIVLSDVVLPIPVDEFLPDVLADLGPEDRMLATGGIAYDDASAAVAVYPDLWPSAEAARKALQRQRCGTLPNENTTIGNCPAPRRLLRVALQRSGAGQRQSFATVDSRFHPDPREALERALGPLAFFEVLEDPPELEAQEWTQTQPVAVPSILSSEQYPVARSEPAEAPPPDLIMVRMSLRDGGVRLGALAAEIGVSLSHLSNAIHGRRKLKPDIEAKLMEFAATVPALQGRLL
jgi:putative DNA primase/helicase